MRSALRPLPVSLAVLLSGLLLAVFCAWQLQRDNRAVMQARFDELATQAAVQLTARMAAYASGLQGARGAVIAAGEAHMDRARFQAYAHSRDVEQEFPGALGFGLIRRVPPSQLSAFVAAAQQEGTPHFQARQFAQGDHHIGVEQVVVLGGGLEILREENKVATGPEQPQGAAQQLAQLGQDLPVAQVAQVVG